MKDKAYIVVSKGGIHKLYKGKPTLQPGQVAFVMNLEIPDSVFDNAFQSLNLTLSEEQLLKPPVSIEVGDPIEADDESEDRDERKNRR